MYDELMYMSRVLVVDDEKAIVKGIKFSLEQDDAEVSCAYDGEEALELAKSQEFDIILLDLMLPKIDGLSVCRQIREFSNVPIIMKVLIEAPEGCSYMPALPFF